MLASRAPEGTIALLSGEIRESARLTAELGSGWSQVLADHHRLVGDAIAAEGGFPADMDDHGFVATFAQVSAAAAAAVRVLRALGAHGLLGEAGALTMGMGLHVGYAERRGERYAGVEISRAASVAAAAHGGQLLMTRVRR